jgi:hypothetical protein
MSQYIGLILLIVAVAAGLYLLANTEDLLKIKFEVPELMRPRSVSFPSAGGVDEEGVVVIEARKSAQISFIKWPSDFAPYIEARIDANVVQGELVNVTGWTVKSNSGSFSIPQAQKIYSFGGNQGDINLRSSDTLYLYSGMGPKGNFRLNKCLGYIEDLSPFTPSLPKDCPSISRSEITGFSGACQDYLLSLNVCENPSANPPVPLSDNACHSFLNKLNYVGCVEKYKNDADFLQNEWRVWLDEKINIFDPLHDKVQLLDKKGKIVDEYVY